MAQSKALNNVFKLNGIAYLKEPRFGAKGDGVTDDTAAWQAALAVATDLDLGDGTYLITAATVLTNTTLKRIKGNGATIICATPGLVANSNILDTHTNSIAIELDGITFIPSAYVSVGTNACRTGNLSFNYHAYQSGPFLYEGSTIRRCKFQHLNQGAYIAGDITNTEIKTLIEDNEFTECASTLTAYLLGNVVFRGNKGYLGSEATFPSCGNLEISGNDMFMPGTPAIDVGGSAAAETHTVSIYGNRSYGRDGIVVEGGGRNVSICDNICYVTADSPNGVGVGVTAVNAGGQDIYRLTIADNTTIHYGDEDGAVKFAYGVRVSVTLDKSSSDVHIHDNHSKGATVAVYVRGYDDTKKCTNLTVFNNTDPACGTGGQIEYADNIVVNDNDWTGGTYGVTIGSVGSATLKNNRTRDFTNHYRIGTLTAMRIDNPDHNAANEAALFNFVAATTGNVLGLNIRVPWAGIEPTAGRWTNGSYFLADGSSLGAVVGKICTTSGTSGTWSVFSGQAGYRSGAGSPVGAAVPTHIGEEYLNTTGPQWFKSTGLTNADWVALN